jgi:transcriptional regulator with XRE-family HTH domain
VAESFGEMFKRLRLESGQTLRAFCLRHNFDPGNVSKLERGRMPPPEGDSLIRQYASALGIRDREVLQVFCDLAATERGKIPSDIQDEPELLDKLPVLFRVLRGTKTSGETLDQLVEKVRHS